MGRKAVSGIMLSLLSIGMLPWTFSIQPVEASGTVYIRADGSVDPPGAPISSPDNITYTFTGNINDFLVIERSDIIVDGAGYRLQGPESGRGIDLLSYVSNVTIRNIDIRGFEFGIYAELCWDLNISRNNIEVGIVNWGILLHWSWNNIIARNNLTSAWGGVAIDLKTSPYNTLAENYITGNEHGIRLNNSLNCKIVRNNIDTNGCGIELTDSSDNNILARNNVTTTVHGINLSASSNNTLAENQITDITGDGYGIGLKDSSNSSLTENTIIGRRPFSQQGIWLNSSNNNTLAGNKVTNNNYGIYLSGSSNNTLAGNNATSNWRGIYLAESSNYNSIIANNTIASNEYGIWLSSSLNNTLVENYIIDNEYGIGLLYNALYNCIYHNNFANVMAQAFTDGSPNVWDDGYPSGGNYWSNYGGVDLYQGPYQNETGSDNIGDTSYTINVNNTDRYPLVDLWTPLFDMAVLNVTLSKTVVCHGFSMSINITVENQGIWPQAFNVTINAFTMPPAIPIVTLIVPYIAPQTSKTLRFTWNTSGFGKGYYTISAYAWPVQGETDVEDNTLTDGWLIVSMIGDITGPDGWPDGKVDIRDIALVAKAFGANMVTDPNSPKYGQYWHSTPCSTCPHHPNCDITGSTIGVPDGKIDIRDIAIVAKRFGQVDP